MNAKLYFSFIKVLCFCSCVIIGNDGFCQSLESSSADGQKSNLQLGFNVGYDLLPSYSSDFTYYDVSGGLKFGLNLDYNIGLLGLGLDYDFLKNSPASSLSNPVFYDTLQITSSAKEDLLEGISRQFIGIGPNLNLEIGSALGVKAFGRIGWATTKGGELITTAIHPNGTKVDHHVMFSGLDAAGLAMKLGLGINYSLSEKLGVNLGAYYLNHLSVKPDRNFDLNSRGNMGIVYGHTPFVTNQNNYAIGLGAPYIIDSPVDFGEVSHSFSSIGLNLGVTYLLRSTTKTKKEKEVEKKVADMTTVVITVTDEISNKPIPGADVIVKDMNGLVASSSKTNSYGVLELSHLEKGNYVISANVYGVETSMTNLMENEFDSGATINKTVLYSDLRFILKGNALNKKTRTGEPGVIVSLTHSGNRSVLQESTQGDGGFAFKLDKNSSYEIVGVKENRLSDIKRASTVGLNRSTTLFVNLELGVENFDCGRGTKMDIKYDYDKWDLLSESKFELDKVIRYMKDHPTSIVEMSAHTDSRGSNDYNLTLSDKRANSAKTYIQSRGISPSRVTAQGYGETRLKNHCKDGTNCSEADHALNRRTEATLICRR